MNFNTKFGLALLQVMNVHNSIDKFLSLIPFLSSDEKVQLSDIEWGKEFADVPVTSQLRVLTGMKLLT